MRGLGIDLGTANTVVCHTRRGIILDEPSVMVLRAQRRRPKVVTVGREARAIIGRTPERLVAVRPLRDGVITDLETARAFIKAILQRLPIPPWGRLGARAAIGAPLGATVLERRALIEAAGEARLRRVSLIAEPIAGALGCGIDVLEPRAHMVVDIGGGTSEVTAFCYGEVLTHRSCRIAGDEMTFAVYEYLRQEHRLVLGELTVEDTKIRAATEQGPSLTVEGKDAATGRPRLVTVAFEELAEAIRPVTDAIVMTLAACLEDLPAQVVSDVTSDGVLAFGGGSLMRGFDKLLEDALGFSVQLAERPLTCVAEGAAAALRHRDALGAFAA